MLRHIFYPLLVKHQLRRLLTLQEHSIFTLLCAIAQFDFIEAHIKISTYSDKNLQF